MLIIRDEKNTAINHNNRKPGYYEHNKNIDTKKLTNNINYVKFNKTRIEKEINEMFKEDIEKYNKNQKRKSYQVENYFQEKEVIKNQRELLIEITENKEEELLEEFYKQTSKYILNKKNMYVTNMVVHKDENTWHMHVNWIPINKREKRIQSWTTFNQWKKEQSKKETKRSNEQFMEAINKIGEEIQRIGKEIKIEARNNKYKETKFKEEELEYTKLGTKKEKQIHLKVEEYKEKVVKKGNKELEEEKNKLNKVKNERLKQEKELKTIEVQKNKKEQEKEEIEQQNKQYEEQRRRYEYELRQLKQRQEEETRRYKENLKRIQMQQNQELEEMIRKKEQMKKVIQNQEPYIFEIKNKIMIEENTLNKLTIKNQEMEEEISNKEQKQEELKKQIKQQEYAVQNIHQRVEKIDREIEEKESIYKTLKTKVKEILTGIKRYWKEQRLSKYEKVLQWVSIDQKKPVEKTNTLELNIFHKENPELELKELRKIVNEFERNERETNLFDFYEYEYLENEQEEFTM